MKPVWSTSVSIPPNITLLLMNQPVILTEYQFCTVSKTKTLQRLMLKKRKALLLELCENRTWNDHKSKRSQRCQKENIRTCLTQWFPVVWTNSRCHWAVLLLYYWHRLSIERQESRRPSKHHVYINVLLLSRAFFSPSNFTNEHVRWSLVASNKIQADKVIIRIKRRRASKWIKKNYRFSLAVEWSAWRMYGQFPKRLTSSDSGNDFENRFKHVVYMLLIPFFCLQRMKFSPSQFGFLSLFQSFPKAKGRFRISFSFYSRCPTLSFSRSLCDVRLSISLLGYTQESELLVHIPNIMDERTEFKMNACVDILNRSAVHAVSNWVS